MAYRRGLTTRANLLCRWHQHRPTVSHLVRNDEDYSQPAFCSPSPSMVNNYMQQQYHFATNRGGNLGTGLLFALHKCSFTFSMPPVVGLQPSYCRFMSTSTGEGSDSVDYIKDIADVLTDKTAEVVTSQAPVISEVAAAAADSAMPVAALQYLIDGVHSLTGLNWWAAIALTTILIRGATLPLLINQLKSTSKLNALKPQLEEIQLEVKNSGMDPIVVAAGQKRVKALFKEHGVSPFTALRGLLFQGPIFISFFFAISNMVEKVPSFKVGGAFWFTDLTTPDSLYALPVLASLSFLITVECNVQEGLEGNSVAGTMKKFSRVLALLTVPFTATFPKALFCYWITSNLFSLSYGLVLKVPEVRKFLNLPVPLVQPKTQQQRESSSVLAVKQLNSVGPEPALSNQRSEVAEKRISSHTVLNQRIRNLEKKVKGRKKGNKR